MTAWFARFAFAQWRTSRAEDSDNVVTEPARGARTFVKERHFLHYLVRRVGFIPGAAPHIDSNAVRALNRAHRSPTRTPFHDPLRSNACTIELVGRENK